MFDLNLAETATTANPRPSTPLLDLHDAWRAAHDEADLLNADWRDAPRKLKRDAYFGYAAAAEREDAAAAAFMRAAAQAAT